MPVKLSIVIPTRERSNTLRHALRTCVDQTYAPLEIIVSDNASADDTREVVESFQDPRIVYVNTGRRIGMSRNWEHALAAVTGDFVTFVGDDDGLLPGAVADVAALIAAHGAQAVAWEKVQYGWPNHPLPDFAGAMSLPLANRLFACDARTFARDCATFWTAFTKGPSLYNAFVSVPAIRSVQARSGGVFFHSVIPDAYSAMAVCSGIDRYYFSSRPFSVNGASGHSNGANTDAFLAGGKDGTSATRTFVDETDLPLHRDMPVLIMGSSVAVILEAVLQANDRCFGGGLPVDIDAALGKIVKEVAASQPVRYEAVREQLLDLTKSDPRRQKVVRAALARYPNRPGAAGGRPPALGRDDTLWMDLMPLGVGDVHAAAGFAAHVIGPYVAPGRVSRYSHYSKVGTRAFTEVRQRLDPHLW